MYWGHLGVPLNEIDCFSNDVGKQIIRNKWSNFDTLNDLGKVWIPTIRPYMSVVSKIYKYISLMSHTPS